MEVYRKQTGRERLRDLLGAAFLVAASPILDRLAVAFLLRFE
jgi:hypothetical protein